jgi:hypothetical protein
MFKLKSIISGILIFAVMFFGCHNSQGSESTVGNSMKNQSEDSEAVSGAPNLILKKLMVLFRSYPVTVEETRKIPPTGKYPPVLRATLKRLR